MSEAPEVTGKQTINRGAGLVFIILLALLAWYISADRLTPYTSQARVEGFVVGVAPKVAGSITQVNVSNNQRVDAGDLLFSIDQSDYLIAIERATSDLEKARQQLAAGDAGVDAARAGLEAALANEMKSAKDFERLSRLYEQDSGTISKRRLEMSEASLVAATAQVAAARATIQQAIDAKGGDNDGNNAYLKSAQSALAKAQLDLDNTFVKAAKSGVITDLRAEVGQFAGVGKPVMTLVATDELWINAAFTENNLSALSEGAKVELLFDVLPGQVYSGYVRSVGLGISASQNTQPGTLPSVQNNRDWLRQAQRFPVQVEIADLSDAELRSALRMGGQASVVAYGDAPWILRTLAWLSIRMRSFLSYAY
ncbi:MAG: HlyD family secretion protein [Luminiphilus sp.]|nr:HlyD family secretion protein [Luminiphilus sp.]